MNNLEQIDHSLQNNQYGPIDTAALRLQRDQLLLTAELLREIRGLRKDMALIAKEGANVWIK